VTGLEGILADTAERIVEQGTAAESRILEEVAAATRATFPGAAAALVDWSGSEVARLRAFGLLHGVVLSELGPHDRSRLLDRILGRPDLALAG